MTVPANNTAQEPRTDFKSRIAVLAVLLAFCFALVIGRLAQLQILRHDQYAAIAHIDSGKQQLVPSLRAAITDRDGEVLAEERPFFDLAVRVDQLKLQRVTLNDAQKERALDLSPVDRKARAEKLAERLTGDPFVVRLAQTIKAEPLELARGVFTALDNVARKPAWAAASASQVVARGVDEDIWLALRSVHEDQFRNTLALGRKEQKDALERTPPFPGLSCLLSARRVYPRGTFAAHVLGYVGELSEEDDQQLRCYGILFDNAKSKQDAWVALRSALTNEQDSAALSILGDNPREIDDCARLLDRIASLTPAEQQELARCGLAEPVKWAQRPPRMKLNDAEQLFLGVNMPVASSHNSLTNKGIGEGGIERFYNDFLRSRHALRLASASANIDDTPDSASAESELLKSNESHTDGAFRLTLSSVWQEAAENALNAQGQRGAIVVIDVQDGSILALVSKPGFDPNLLTPPRTGAVRQQQIKALLDDPEKPLLNRAISGEYPLGSIMKSLIASVALEKGLLTPEETFVCPGFIKEGGQIFHCDGNHAHGTVDVYKGLRCSCNVMFHQVGARIGVENLGPFAKLVLGTRTGLDLPAESTGVYPDRAWRQKMFPRNPQARIWTRGNDFQLAIGQGQMNATVLQAAVLMAAVSNGGNVVTPHLRFDAPPAPLKPLGVHERALNIVRRGLDECVNVGTPGERGTCYAPFHANGELPLRVAGKTSTAEHGHDLAPHAWFAGYFPSEHPRYAFAVMLEEAGHGGLVAGPVAFNMLREIYGTRQNPNPHPGERQQNVAQADTVEGR